MIHQHCHSLGCCGDDNSTFCASGLCYPKRFVEADLSSNEGTMKVIEAVKERFGTIDIVVNNVGGAAHLREDFLRQVTNIGSKL